MLPFTIRQDVTVYNGNAVANWCFRTKVRRTFTVPDNQVDILSCSLCIGNSLFNFNQFRILLYAENKSNLLTIGHISLRIIDRIVRTGIQLSSETHRPVTAWCVLVLLNTLRIWSGDETPSHYLIILDGSTAIEVIGSIVRIEAATRSQHEGNISLTIGP